MACPNPFSSPNQPGDIRRSSSVAWKNQPFASCFYQATPNRPRERKPESPRATSHQVSSPNVATSDAKIETWMHAEGVALLHARMWHKHQTRGMAGEDIGLGCLAFRKVLELSLRRFELVSVCFTTSKTKKELEANTHIFISHSPKQKATETPSGSPQLRHSPPSPSAPHPPPIRLTRHPRNPQELDHPRTPHRAQRVAPPIPRLARDSSQGCGVGIREVCRSQNSGIVCAGSATEGGGGSAKAEGADRFLGKRN